MISREEVLHVAQLARLTLKEEDIAELQKDMSAVIEYVGQVSAVASENIVTPAGAVLRPDTPRAAHDLLAHKEGAIRDAFPTKEGQFNVVRKIIDKDA